MSDVDPAPDASPHPPRSFTLPAGSVDSHAHVIGTEYIEGRSYTPHPAPERDYLRMLDATGMSYGVLVQVSVHGTDNGLMLRALKANPDRLRGIAVVSHDASDAELAELKASGVVGLRLNTTTGGGVGVSRIGHYGAMCRELDWHLQVLVEPQLLPSLTSAVASSSVPVVFDHMGYVRPGADMEKARMALVRMVRDGAWVKLSGAFRLSRIAPPYGDMIELTRALFEAAPNRCVWGSDWPHVHFRGTMPNTGDLLDLLGECLPDAPASSAVLASNPQRLYGFAPVP